MVTYNVEKRYKSHLDGIKRFPKYPLYRAFQKYGKENFTVEVIEECKSREQVCELERYYINKFKSNNRKYGYNQTSGGEDNCGSANPRATLTDKEVLTIRKLRFSGICNAVDAYKQYENKISFSAFSKIWAGKTWKHIGQEFFNKPSLNVFKKHVGEKNGMSLSTDEEIMEIRLYYVNHTLHETYLKYGSKYKTEHSFRQIIANGYKHLPIYNKVKKKWLLNNEIIDINTFTNPVSTISESGE